MSVGMSWPAGHGRRTWVSVPASVFLIGFVFLMPVWLAVWVIYGLLKVAVWAIERWMT